jgi:hypothetical protein
MEDVVRSDLLEGALDAWRLTQVGEEDAVPTGGHHVRRMRVSRTAPSQAHDAPRGPVQDVEEVTPDEPRRTRHERNPGGVDLG